MSISRYPVVSLGRLLFTTVVFAAVSLFSGLRVSGATNAYFFTYTNRTALLADGWSFVATSPGGIPRNTEVTNGAVVSYDQDAHAGCVQIPCDIGDLFGALNNSRNSLFRLLASNWISLRLQLSFAPVTNFQQVNLALYQDDDNYLETSLVYNGSNSVALFREVNQFTLTVSSSSNSTTNLFLRLDQDLNTGNVSSLYSRDGTNWNLLNTISQSLTNARLAVWVGGSGFPYTNNSPVASVRSVYVITDDNYVSPPPGLVASPQHLVFNAIAGVPCTNIQALHVVTSNSRVSPVTWALTNTAPWCITSATNGSTPGGCDVSVNAASLAPGIYQTSLGIGAAGATSTVANVTLIVNTNGRARITPWRSGRSGAMSVWIDDSNPTAFDDLSTNKLTGTYVMWHLVAPSFFNSYRQAGMELGSHTVDHPCFPVNENLARYELSTNLVALIATAPVPQSEVVSFAWPCGATSPQEEAVAADYFLAARGYNLNQLETPTPYDFMNLKSYNSHEHFPFPPADLKTVVDAAIATGQWFNLVLHTTNNDNGAIAYSVGKNIWVATGGAVIKYILQRDRTIVSNYVETANSIEFDLCRLPIDPSSLRSFETAVGSQDLLTCQVDTSGYPSASSLTVNGAPVPFTPGVSGGKNVVYFDTQITSSPVRVVVLLQPALTLTRTGQLESSAQLTWASIVGQQYAVECSTNLVDWFSLSNVTATGTLENFIDPTPVPGVPLRFYRLR